MTPKRKAIPFTVVHLIHCRRVRRRNRSANGYLPCDCLLLTKISLNNYKT
ncbi:MAG: hypothetical protein LBK82_09955 [Planctomycetaceae bacterium]|nr:hypothetical protein [Planctomycetaceae bacterium]